MGKKKNIFKIIGFLSALILFIIIMPGAFKLLYTLILVMCKVAIDLNDICEETNHKKQ